METTEILVLNPDGSASQVVQLDYGHAGEVGYRVGIVWDDQNQPGQPVETINTYVSDPNVATEAFDDFLYQNNDSTLLLIGGNEGGRETLAKVFDYSKDNVVAHQDNPNVFSTITVRTDQDINLFSGDDSTVTNALNETRQTLRAELDSPKRFVPNLPKINQINPIEVREVPFLPISSAAPESSSAVMFSRDVQPFESGELKWVQVTIPIDELEEAGDEIRLKDPTKVFATTEGAEVNEFEDEIGENEVEKIVEAIETNEDAEAGYWYKVFKDYDNRDDELFFYHLKSGEVNESDLQTDQGLPVRESPTSGHSEKVDDGSSSQDGNADEGLSDFEADNDQVPSTDLQREPQHLPLDSQTEQGVNLKSTQPAVPLSAASILVAGMVLREKTDPAKTEKKGALTQPDSTSGYDRPDDQPKTIGFKKLDRVTRRIKNAMRRIV